MRYELICKIEAGNLESNIIDFSLAQAGTYARFNLALSNIFTSSAVSLNTSLEILLEVKTEEGYFPLWDSVSNTNAGLQLVQNVVIPCNPCFETVSSRLCKLKINQVQGNDINFVLGLVKI